LEQISKTAYLSCNGCPENLFDTGYVRKYLIHNGWHITDNLENADLILFNACGLTSTLELSSLKIIMDLKARSKAGSRLLVWGCLPKINSEALQKVYDGPFLGERELFFQIDEIIHAKSPIESITNNDEIYQCHTNKNSWPVEMYLSLSNWVLKRRVARGYRNNLYRIGSNSIFYIKTSSGCLGHCTYCAVRLSRGTIKSKSLDSIVREFKSGLAAGYKEFSLLGTDLGYQGNDLGYNLCDLLNELIKHEGVYKIGIRNINPNVLGQLIDTLEPIVKTGKVWYIGLPAESGSNRILKLMGRKYTTEEYVDYFKRLKTAYPEIVIRNQMLVGFPSETERDFAFSLKLVSSLNFDFTEIYPFSRRPGITADKLKGQLPGYLIRLRYCRMLTRVMMNDIFKKT
jgi:MiaB/RimO family radical SAM methylthiotransferase